MSGTGCLQLTPDLHFKGFAKGLAPRCPCTFRKLGDGKQVVFRVAEDMAPTARDSRTS